MATTNKISTKRLSEIRNGISELRNWVDDLLDGGMVLLTQDKGNIIKTFSARMVDTRMPGIAKELRLLSEEISANSDWAATAVKCLGKLHLTCKLFDKFETLEPLMQEDLLTYLGQTKRKADLLKQASLKDEWVVMGHLSYKEERLNVRRTWFRSLHRQDMVFQVEYAFGAQTLPDALPFNSVLNMDVVKFPSQTAFRILIKEKALSRRAILSKFHVDLQTNFDRYAEALALNPWLSSFPFYIESVMPHLENSVLFLADKNSGLAVKLIGPEDVYWKLLSLSRGNTLIAFGEYDGSALKLISVEAENRIVEI